MKYRQTLRLMKLDFGNISILFFEYIYNMKFSYQVFQFLSLILLLNLQFPKIWALFCFGFTFVIHFETDACVINCK